MHRFPVRVDRAVASLLGVAHEIAAASRVLALRAIRDRLHSQIRGRRSDCDILTTGLRLRAASLLCWFPRRRPILSQCHPPDPLIGGRNSFSYCIPHEAVLAWSVRSLQWTGRFQGCRAPCNEHIDRRQGRVCVIGPDAGRSASRRAGESVGDSPQFQRQYGVASAGHDRGGLWSGWEGGPCHRPLPIPGRWSLACGTAERRRLFVVARSGERSTRAGTVQCVAVGAAQNGLRPIVEFMTWNAGESIVQAAVESLGLDPARLQYVPEPSAASLFLGAWLGVLRYRRRPKSTGR